MSNKNDQYYIDEVLKGNKGAFSYLVNRYSGMVYSISLKLLKNEVEAEDLSQEVFVSAFRSLAGFKGSSRFSTWIYRITYNKAISQLRKKKMELSTDSGILLENRGGIDNSADIVSYQKNIEILLKNSIGLLPDSDQLMVMLHYYEDQSMEEIAAITGLSVSNVKVKLFRIRKCLKEVMVKSGFEMVMDFD